MCVSINVDRLSIEYVKYDEGNPSLKTDVLNILRRRISKKSQSYPALDNISISLKSGDRLGVIGRNGAGKTTLMKALAGILEPVEGSVIVKGKMIPLLELGTGFDHQSSVVDNIFMNGAILNFNKVTIESLVPDILLFSELLEFADQPLTKLSSGMKSRLSFSIASFLNPEILLLDEVFAAGDRFFVKKAKQRMIKMIDECKIVVFSSHQQGLIKEICNRAIVLDQGKICFDGDVNKAFDVYNSKYE